MNTPKIQKDDPPTEGTPSDHNPDGTTPHGTPEALRGQEPTGRASNDRLNSETAAAAVTQDKP